MNQEARDPAITRLLERERHRQEQHIELIASENYVSEAVLQAQGSVLTNKYAEGYPGRRYYGGCQIVDDVESLAIERARTLFGAEYANVQPHSGSQANQAVLLSVLKAGDTIMGMSLADGGHLTHGSAVNFSGKLFKAVSYGVCAGDERLDYEQLEQLAHENRPKLIIAGASSYSRHIDFARFRQVCDEVGAYLMVDMAHYAGLVAAGRYPSPIPYADFVTSTTHKTLRGPRGGLILAREQYAAALDKAIFPNLQGGPLMHVIAAKAVAFKEASAPSFSAYQGQVIENAAVMAATLEQRGLRIVSGGTDCHMFLVDLQPLGLNGKEAEALLESAKITLNKNSIPNDPLGPTITSGIRIGSAAITTRGFRQEQATDLAHLIADLLHAPTDAAVHGKACRQVERLCESFPVYR